ncbi:MAG: nicotinamide riboside transporter PnuC [Flavobacteriales bacterium]
MMFWELFIANLKETSALEWIAVLSGVAYVIFAAKENIWCWPASLTGVTIYIFLCFQANLYSEMILQVFYFVMAFYGWSEWLKRKKQLESNPIVSRKITQHVLGIIAIILITLVAGYSLKTYTNAALPYLDAFTSVASIYATYLVAKKVLENWLYWIVIDLVSVYIYTNRQLAMTALLYLFFVIIAIYGYYVWRKNWKKRKLYA